MAHYPSKRSIQEVYPGQYTPLPEMEELTRELQKPREGTVVQPLVNVKDATDSLTVEAAIPGVKRENFLIAVNDHILSIALITKNLHCSAANFHLHEFNYDCCERHVLLPANVNPQLASATYRDGMLYIFMPKGDKPMDTEYVRIAVY